MNEANKITITNGEAVLIAANERERRAIDCDHTVLEPVILFLTTLVVAP